MNLLQVSHVSNDEAPRSLQGKPRWTGALMPLMSLLLLAPGLAACSGNFEGSNETPTEQSAEALSVSAPKVVTAVLNVPTTQSPLAVLTGDINNDGKTDLILPNNLAGRLGVSVYRHSSYYSETWNKNMAQGSGALAWLTNDVDGDGNDDLIQPWNNGGRLGLLVYRGTGSGGFTQSFGTQNVGQGSGALAWFTGDVDADGKADLIQPWDNRGRLGVIVYRGTSSGALAQSFATADIGQPSSGLVLLTGDVDGDRRTDLIHTYIDQGHLGVVVYRGNASGGFTRSYVNPYLGVSYSALKWLTGDVDGDGRTDLIQVMNFNGRLGLIVYRGTASGGFAPSFVRSDMGQGSNALAWLAGDVDGDGKTDLIQPWDNQGILGLIVYSGTASGGFAQSFASGNMVQDSDPIFSQWRVGDADGDGKADVIRMHTLPIRL